jgi:hypothetical protein
MLSDEHAISNTPVPRPAVGRVLSDPEVSKSSSGGFQVIFRVHLLDEKDKMELCGAKMVTAFVSPCALLIHYGNWIEFLVSVSSRFFDLTFQSYEEVWMD